MILSAITDTASLPALGTPTVGGQCRFAPETGSAGAFDEHLQNASRTSNEPVASVSCPTAPEPKDDDGEPPAGSSQPQEAAPSEPETPPPDANQADPPASSHSDDAPEGGDPQQPAEPEASPDCDRNEGDEEVSPSKDADLGVEAPAGAVVQAAHLAAEEAAAEQPFPQVKQDASDNDGESDRKPADSAVKRQVLKSAPLAETVSHEPARRSQSHAGTAADGAASSVAKSKAGAVPSDRQRNVAASEETFEKVTSKETSEKAASKETFEKASSVETSDETPSEVASEVKSDKPNQSSLAKSAVAVAPSSQTETPPTNQRQEGKTRQAARQTVASVPSAEAVAPAEPAPHEIRLASSSVVQPAAADVGLVAEGEAETEPKKASQPVTSEGTSQAEASARVGEPASRGPLRAPATSAPAPPTTGGSDLERVRFVQRVSRAFQAVGKDGGSIRLQLRPPELGSLHLDLTVHKGTMTARLEVETQAARNALLDNLPALRDRLAQQEIKIERFDVNVGEDASGGEPRQPGDQSQFEQRLARTAGGHHASHQVSTEDAARPASGVRPGEPSQLNVVI